MKVFYLHGRLDTFRALARIPDIELGIGQRSRLMHQLDDVPAAMRVVVESKAKMDLASIHLLRKTITRWQPDIVHAYSSKSQVNVALACLRMKNRPAIIGSRGVIAPLRKADLGNWLAYQTEMVDLIECKSAAVEESLIDCGVAAERCLTTWDYATAAAPQQQLKTSLTEFGIPQDAFLVGCVANIRPIKGIDVLLEAFDNCQNLSRAHLVIVGKRDDERVEELKRASQMGDRIHLVGYQSDVPRFLRHLDLFVMPSRQEGLCLGLMEAMQYGIPAIVSEAGGMKEVVRDGVDGCVVPIEDAPALSHAISQLYHDDQLREEFGLSAENRIKDQFSLAAYMKRLIEMYADVFERKRASRLAA